MASRLRGGTTSVVWFRSVAFVVTLTVVSTTCKSPTHPSHAACPVEEYIPLPVTDVWPCPPASAIRDIDAVIDVEVLYDPTAGSFVCHAEDGSTDLTKLQERIYQTLYLLERLQFDAPLPWTSEPLWTWFTSSVHSIRVLQPAATHSPDACCADGGMILQAYSPSQRGFPTEAFVYVHEARHAQVPSHDCGPKDASISELGAVGVQYYFALWVADHATAPPLSSDERYFAKQAAETYRAYDFCTACGGI